MKIFLSWSSGKDSAWALHVLNQRHPGTVGALLTTINESVDRVAMHAVRRDVLARRRRPRACRCESCRSRKRAVTRSMKHGWAPRSLPP